MKPENIRSIVLLLFETHRLGWLPLVLGSVCVSDSYFYACQRLIYFAQVQTKLFTIFAMAMITGGVSPVDFPLGRVRILFLRDTAYVLLLFGINDRFVRKYLRAARQNNNRRQIRPLRLEREEEEKKQP